MQQWTIQHADARTALAGLPSNSVDAVVTDPPAGIGFMGKDWDKDRTGRKEWVSWLEGIMSEAHRVLKPGGHALVWALPRTSHWTATALEDAGFEIRDSLQHLFSTGFPKSRSMREIDRPELGTALKPSHEVWWLCRKPLVSKTVAAQVLDTGTGALNIGATRVPLDSSVNLSARQRTNNISAPGGTYVGSENRVACDIATYKPEGRWPSNLLLSHSPACDLFTCTDDCPVAELDRQSGNVKTGGAGKGANSTTSWFGGGGHSAANSYGDTGGASRFFPTFRYQAKPSRRERNAGLEDFPEVQAKPYGAGREGVGKTGHYKTRQNTHPTVKSVALMRWLCRLITPPGGLVVDPFMGSGTTGVACAAEGFRFWGCDENAEYIQIATARVSAAYKDAPTPSVPVVSSRTEKDEHCTQAYTLADLDSALPLHLPNTEEATA